MQKIGIRIWVHISGSGCYNLPPYKNFNLEILIRKETKTKKILVDDDCMIKWRWYGKITNSRDEEMGITFADGIFKVSAQGIRHHILPLCRLTPQPPLRSIVSLASSVAWSICFSPLCLIINILLRRKWSSLPVGPGFLITGGAESAVWTGVTFHILLNGQISYQMISGPIGQA